MTDGKNQKEHHIKMHWKSFAEKVHSSSDDDEETATSAATSTKTEEVGEKAATAAASSSEKAPENVMKDLSLDDNKTKSAAVEVQ